MRDLSSQFWQAGLGSRGEATGGGDGHKGSRFLLLLRSIC
jgi:hypothetical protein